MNGWFWFTTAALFWIAGNIFFVASIVSMGKKHLHDSFCNALNGLLCLLVVVVVLP